MAGPFTETDASARPRAHRAAWAVLPMALVLAIFSGGCAAKKAKAQVPAANAPPAKPIPVEHAYSAAGESSRREGSREFGSGFAGNG
jgi:50S ribosomal subunit-associated GTPase HflX